MNNFKPRPYTPRTWENESTVLIPLESKEVLQDPRRKSQKRVIPSISEIPEKSKKTEKINNFNAEAKEKFQQEDIPRIHTEEDIEVGLILHISESDEKLFPDAQLKEACKTYDNSEKRKVLHGLFKSICRSGVNPEKTLRIRGGAMQVYHHNQ